jgi:hypothetical protein
MIIHHYGSLCANSVSSVSALKKERYSRNTIIVLRKRSQESEVWPAGLRRLGQFFDSDFKAEHLQTT